MSEFLKDVDLSALQEQTPIEILKNVEDLVMWLSWEQNIKMRRFIRTAALNQLEYLEDFLVK